jgi:hypothetical protein
VPIAENTHPRVFDGFVKVPGSVLQMVKTKDFGGVVAHPVEYSCD